MTSSRSFGKKTDRASKIDVDGCEEPTYNSEAIVADWAAKQAGCAKLILAEHPTFTAEFATSIGTIPNCSLDAARASLEWDLSSADLLFYFFCFKWHI